MALSSQQKHKLKVLLKELGNYRGRHTEMVTVFVPQGYDMNKIINHISQEQGTATNIKSTSTRKNVLDALEKMIQHLRLYKKTPENGLAVFSGNVAEREGQSNVKVWAIEPPVPLNIRIYRCDKEFVLEPLKDMLETKEVYGLVVMDRREANIAYLKGKLIVPISDASSNVPGKTRAGGQCLMPSSIVQLADGTLKNIKGIHNPHMVKSMKNTKISDSPVTDKWHAIKNKVYRIQTKNPVLRLESSKDHLFFVNTNKGIIEKPAEELKKGDYLLMPEKIDVKGKIQNIDSKQYYNSFTINRQGRLLLKKKRIAGKLLQKELAQRLGFTQTAISVIELGKRNVGRKSLKKLCRALDIDFNKFIEENCIPYLYREVKLPKTLTPGLARICGYFTGDGSIEKDRISFFEQDQDVAFYYKSLSARMFGTSVSYRFRQSKNYHQLRITSRPLVRLFKGIFPELKLAKDSKVPELVMKSKDDIVAHFLKGIFDAEGYATLPRGIGLGMNNQQLVRQIQMLLLRFGIISSVSEYDNRVNPYSDNPRFTIQISEKESLLRFREYIDFLADRKSEKLKNIIENKSDVSYVRQIAVSGSRIRNIIEKAGYNIWMFPKVSNFFYDKRMISKQIFRDSILSKIKDKKLLKELKKVLEIPLLPVKINSIDILKKKAEMVDISIGNESFIANGIFVHNSSARYMRIREDAAKDFYKKIADMMKEAYLGNEGLKGIIVGGPGPTKYEFVESGYITGDIKKKIIGIKDLSYTGPFGLQELLDRAQDLLASEEVADEKRAMTKFFEKLAKQPEFIGYGEEEVMNQLKMGAVDTLLLSESLEDEKIDLFDEEAQKSGTSVKMISVDTREGVQLRDLGKVAAILRYPVHS